MAQTAHDFISKKLGVTQLDLIAHPLVMMLLTFFAVVLPLSAWKGRRDLWTRHYFKRNGGGKVRIAALVLALAAFYLTFAFGRQISTSSWIPAQLL